MNFIRNHALSVSVFALALGLGASVANAQGLRGTFNLPFQAHWGNAVLEPGEYALRLSRGASNFPLIYVSRQGKTIMVVAGTSEKTESERSYLRIEDVGQVHVVREFSSGVAGTLYSFSIPKSIKNHIGIAQNRTLPVAPSAGN